jgi:hypothetical protein
MRAPASSFLGLSRSDRLVYFAFFPACSAACLADEFAAAETFVTLDGDEACAVADITFYYAFLGGQLAGSLAFIAFRWD